MRVHLGGEDFAAFIGEADPVRLAKTDKYVKLLFAKPELDLEPPYDLEELRERLPIEDLPVRRTYTIRSIDAATATLAIDFVLHGDEGVAGPWASSAEPGDFLCFSGPGGIFEPSMNPLVPRLYLGDESALPAIAAALEVTPASAHGLVLLEVGSEADLIDLSHPVGVEVQWRFRERADGTSAVPGTMLVEAARELPVPDVIPEVFAHGERGAMRELRVLLHDGWGIERRALSLSAYWALGRAEDGFQAEKRNTAGQIFENE